MKMSEVDRLLAMTENHFGVSLVGETLMEEKLKKWKEKTKEESSTSEQAEEMLGESKTHLYDLESRKPILHDHHIGPAVEREPVFPWR